MLSFIIPAHDEELLIEATVRAIRAAADGLAFEIVVVDDASSDRTAACAEAAGARVVRAECRQISGSRNAGAAAARGELFIFVDADTLVSREAVTGAVRAIEQGAIGGGAGVKFDEPTPRWFKLLLPVALWVYRRFRLASGAFLYCTRAAFEAVGGFDREVYAGEEALMSRALGKQGKFVILRESVLTSGRKLRTHSAWELLSTLAGLAVRGRRGVRDRSRLGVWYDPRRPDPNTGRDPS